MTVRSLDILLKTNSFAPSGFQKGILINCISTVASLLSVDMTPLQTLFLNVGVWPDRMFYLVFPLGKVFRTPGIEVKRWRTHTHEYQMVVILIEPIHTDTYLDLQETFGRPP